MFHHLFQSRAEREGDMYEGGQIHPEDFHDVQCFVASAKGRDPAVASRISMIA